MHILFATKYILYARAYSNCIGIISRIRTLHTMQSDNPSNEIHQ